MRILVTGAAGFIGFHLCKRLLFEGFSVFGIDNLNDYYDPNLKELRLQELAKTENNGNFEFEKIDISNDEDVKNIFQKNKFDIVINLAAQAGVRYSLENPSVYLDSNVTGFLNILESCRFSEIKHLIFASSSSVYGMNIKQPFATDDNVDFPVSLYAATKKANELMAHTYSHLFNIPTTGLRFFTVYGEYGRPDMAYFSFTKKILNNEVIDVFNNGELKRDFTYIDDIIEGIYRLINLPPKPMHSNHSSSRAQFKIYNIGNNNPITLKQFINAIEAACGTNANKRMLPMQPGDVPITFADISDLRADIGFKPDTKIEDGIKRFVSWYKDYSNT